MKKEKDQIYKIFTTSITIFAYIFLLLLLYGVYFVFTNPYPLLDKIGSVFLAVLLWAGFIIDRIEKGKRKKLLRAIDNL